MGTSGSKSSCAVIPWGSLCSLESHNSPLGTLSGAAVSLRLRGPTKAGLRAAPGLEERPSYMLLRQRLGGSREERK